MKTNEEIAAGLEYIKITLIELKQDAKEIVDQTRKTNGRVTKNEVEIAKIKTQLLIGTPIIASIVSIALNVLFAK